MATQTKLNTSKATDAWIGQWIGNPSMRPDTISPTMSRFVQDWMKRCAKPAHGQFTPALAAAEHFDNWLAQKGAREQSHAQDVLIGLNGIYTLIVRDGVVGFDGVIIQNDGDTWSSDTSA